MRRALPIGLMTIVAGVGVVPLIASAAPSSAHSTSPVLNDGPAHGKHGKFSFVDTRAANTGATCHYSGSQLTSVTVAAPLAAGRAYWLRGQYVPWKGKLEVEQGKTWKVLAVAHGGEAKPLKPAKLTARPALTITTNGKAPATGVYRVEEKIVWIANLPGGPIEGWVKHLVTNYHVGFGTKVRSACSDSAPTVSAPSSLSVNGGDTLTLDAPGLLANAQQAQNDPLHAKLVTAFEDGKAWKGATVSGDGRLSVATAVADIGKQIALRYQVVDSAGRVSPIVKVLVNVTVGAPTAANQSYGPATPGQTLTVAAPGLLDAAGGTGLTVNAVTNTSFDPTADAFTWTPDGGFAVTPTAADEATGTLTFSYTVANSHGTSAPATATISLAPTAVDQIFGPATPGQALQVAAPGLLAGAAGPGLTVGPLTNSSFDQTADALTVNADGSLTITPTTADDSTTLTFSYTVINANNIASAPQTVTIPVGHLPPVGVNDNFSVVRGTTLSGCVLPNDTFYGNPQSISSTTPVHATWSSTTYNFVFTDSTGCFTMAPSPRRQATTLTFTYQPIDTINGNSTTGSTATVTITVT